MNLFTKQKQTHRHRKQTMVTKGERRGRDKLGVWEQQIHTTIYKINNKDLLYSTGNYTQYFVITCMGKNLKKKIYIYVCVYVCIYIYIYIYISESLCCTPETNITL